MLLVGQVAFYEFAEPDEDGKLLGSIISQSYILRFEQLFHAFIHERYFVLIGSPLPVSLSLC